MWMGCPISLLWDHADPHEGLRTVTMASSSSPKVAVARVLLRQQEVPEWPCRAQLGVTDGWGLEIAEKHMVAEDTDGQKMQDGWRAWHGGSLTQHPDPVTACAGDNGHRGWGQPEPCLELPCPLLSG